MEKIFVVIKKGICLFFAALMFFCFSSIFLGCKDNNIYEGELLRLHIRANSNDACDQSVKLKVRDAVNSYIESNIDKTTFDAAYAEVGERLSALGGLADKTLRAYGFDYGARARLANEYFPTRTYGDVTVPEGYYDALIIELGDGAGDNWWCVVYPPLCYGSDFEYKSIFAELFG